MYRTVIAAVAAILCMVGRPMAAEVPRPNIVFFFIDDMGWQDTSVPFHTETNELNRHRVTNWTLRKNSAYEHGHATLKAPRWNINGVSFVPLLKQTEGFPADRPIYWHYPQHLRPVALQFDPPVRLRGV